MRVSLLWGCGGELCEGCEGDMCGCQLCEGCEGDICEGVSLVMVMFVSIVKVTYVSVSFVRVQGDMCGCDFCEGCGVLLRVIRVTYGHIRV